MALIRANCAMACLKLQMYSDAYTHCMECVKLDPENHKVGMYIVCIYTHAYYVSGTGKITKPDNLVTLSFYVVFCCLIHDLVPSNLCSQLSTNKWLLQGLFSGWGR